MTKAEIEEQIKDIKKLMEDSQEKLSELEKMLSEKSNEIPPFPTFNDNDKDIYYLSDHGDISSISNLTGGTIIDFNAFHSKALAQEYAKISLRAAMLLHCKWYLCPDYKPDFSTDEAKWSVFYDHDSESYMLGLTYGCDSNVYFDTKENAQRAANWMSTHTLRPD